MVTAELAEAQSNKDGCPVPEPGERNRIRDLASHFEWWPACAFAKTEDPRGDLPHSLFFIYTLPFSQSSSHHSPLICFLLTTVLLGSLG